MITSVMIAVLSLRKPAHKGKARSKADDVHPSQQAGGRRNRISKACRRRPHWRGPSTVRWVWLVGSEAMRDVVRSARADSLTIPSASRCA